MANTQQNAYLACLNLLSALSLNCSAERNGFEKGIVCFVYAIVNCDLAHFVFLLTF